MGAQGEVGTRGKGRYLGVRSAERSVHEHSQVYALVHGESGELVQGAVFRT